MPDAARGVRGYGYSARGIPEAVAAPPPPQQKPQRHHDDAGARVFPSCIEARLQRVFDDMNATGRPSFARAGGRQDQRENHAAVVAPDNRRTRRHGDGGGDRVERRDGRGGDRRNDEGQWFSPASPPSRVVVQRREFRALLESDDSQAEDRPPNEFQKSVFSPLSTAFSIRRPIAIPRPRHGRPRPELTTTSQVPSVKQSYVYAAQHGLKFPREVISTPAPAANAMKKLVEMFFRPNELREGLRRELIDYVDELRQTRANRLRLTQTEDDVDDDAAAAATRRRAAPLVRAVMLPTPPSSEMLDPDPDRDRERRRRGREQPELDLGPRRRRQGDPDPVVRDLDRIARVAHDDGGRHRLRCGAVAEVADGGDGDVPGSLALLQRRVARARDRDFPAQRVRPSREEVPVDLLRNGARTPPRRHTRTADLLTPPVSPEPPLVKRSLTEAARGYPWAAEATRRVEYRPPPPPANRASTNRAGCSDARRQPEPGNPFGAQLPEFGVNFESFAFPGPGPVPAPVPAPAQPYHRGDGDWRTGHDSDQPRGRGPSGLRPSHLEPAVGGRGDYGRPARGGGCEMELDAAVWSPPPPTYYATPVMQELPRSPPKPDFFTPSRGRPSPDRPSERFYDPGPADWAYENPRGRSHGVGVVGGDRSGRDAYPCVPLREKAEPRLRATGSYGDVGRRRALGRPDDDPLLALASQDFDSDRHGRF